MFHLSRRSRNEKTGPIPVSCSTAKTCPLSCPFNKGAGGAGCYAADGPLSWHWGKVTRGERGAGMGAFCQSIRALPAGQLWRHNAAGDLPGTGDKINRRDLARLVSANAGRRGFTYTHKPMTPANRGAVQAANAGGFTVNLSANNLAHADALSDLAIAPVVAVLPVESGRPSHKENKVTVWDEPMESYRARIAGMTTPGGLPVAVCPATYREDITCKSCGVCQRGKRRAVIGFPAHGVNKGRASQIAKGG